MEDISILHFSPLCLAPPSLFRACVLLPLFLPALSLSPSHVHSPAHLPPAALFPTFSPSTPPLTLPCRTPLPPSSRCLAVWDMWRATALSCRRRKFGWQRQHMPVCCCLHAITTLCPTPQCDAIFQLFLQRLTSPKNSGAACRHRISGHLTGARLGQYTPTTRHLPRRASPRLPPRTFCHLQARAAWYCLILYNSAAWRFLAAGQTPPLIAIEHAGRTTLFISFHLFVLNHAVPHLRLSRNSMAAAAAASTSASPARTIFSVDRSRDAIPAHMGADLPHIN